MSTTPYPGGVSAHPDRDAIDARLLAGETGAALHRSYPELTRKQLNDRARRLRKRGGSAATVEPHVGENSASFRQDGTGTLWLAGFSGIPGDAEVRAALRHVGCNPDDYEWWVAEIKWASADWHRTEEVAAQAQAHTAFTKPSCRVRIDVRPRATAVEDPAELLDVEALSRRLRRRLPREVRRGDGRYLVVVLADWQIGKGEGGGTPAFVERMRSLCVAIRERLRDARRCGRPYSGVAFLGLGDLVEQCYGHYAMQAFGVDLSRRDQINLASDALVALVDVVIDEGVEDVLVAAVPGNHGENRNASGKAFTTWSDNDDLLLVDGVRRAFELASDRYGRVRFAMPTEEDTPTDPADPLVLVVDIAGVPVGLTHGHVKKGSGHAAPKMEDWWRRQCMGNRPVARAQILFSGHLHHYICSEATGRTFFQAPALDGGSYWYTASSGASSHPGVLMVDVGTVCGPRMWAHPDVVPCLPLEVED